MSQPKRVRDRDGDQCTVRCNAGMRTVDVSVEEAAWCGTKAQALELAEAIREAAESLSDAPPDPWALLEEAQQLLNKGHSIGPAGEWRDRVGAAVKWHRENGGEG